MRAIQCKDLEEIKQIELCLQKTTGRTYPYTTPINPEDRIGFDDGSTVIIEQITSPIITESNFLYPISQLTESIISSLTEKEKPAAISDNIIIDINEKDLDEPVEIVKELEEIVK